MQAGDDRGRDPRIRTDCGTNAPRSTVSCYGFFDLINQQDSLRFILKRGPKKGADALSQFIAGHIGLMLCENVPDIRNDATICSTPWYESMLEGMKRLENQGNDELKTLVVGKFSLAYIFSLTAYSRRCRDLAQYEKAAQCIEEVFAYQSRHPQIKNYDGYHMKALLLWSQITTILNGTGENVAIEQVLRKILEEDFIFAEELNQELRHMSAGIFEEYKWLVEISEDQKRLVPNFSMMLDRADIRCKAYNGSQSQPGSDTLTFLCSASFVAKAYSIYAALSPGNSGIAYNLLGSLASNNSEVLENNPKLPFFKMNPQLHINLPNLGYPNRFMASYQIYLQLYNVRRGSQPYSARRLCEMLLRRQVCLDENGQPKPGCGNEPFTDVEMDFLARATARATLNHGNSETYWRVRYLHEFARKNGGQRIDNVKYELRKLWMKCSCDEKLLRLNSSVPETVDFISALVILEDLLLNIQKDIEVRNERYRLIFNYLHRYREQARKDPKFSVGICAQDSDVQDCLSRIARLKQDCDSFIIQDMISTYKF